MAILKILKEGDETLRKKSREITEITPRIKTLVEDMIQTLHKTGGVGLAAPQVGVLRRLVIVETEPGDLKVLINPRIVECSGEQTGLEGCLSLPGKWGEVTRPMTVTVVATNLEGQEVKYVGTELEARCFCHEIDHLDGVLYIDRADHMLTKEELEEYEEYDEDEE